MKKLHEGALEPEAREQLESHVRSCERCLPRLRTFEGEPETTAYLERAPPVVSGGIRRAKALPPPLARGTSLGRYVVLDLLGSGGMGVVYAAFDPQLNRRVAIKLLTLEDGSGGPSDDLRRWVLREAQAMARLSHPNVVTVHDVGTYEERVFITMELVEGRTAREWLDERERSWKEVLEVFLAAGEGLAAAHSAGIAHRDFKPDNILVGADGRTRVVDFGLARSAEDEAIPFEDALADKAASTLSGTLDTPLTRAGHRMGTAAYAAPEQLLGARADERSDQFSYAVALYEGLYGARPFEGNPQQRPEETRWTVREPPRDSRVPAWLRRVLLRALSPTPEARHPSIAALLSALRQDPVRQRRLRLAAAGAGLSLACLAGVGALVHQRSERWCIDVGRDAQTVWNLANQQAARRALSAASPASSERTWQSVDAALQRYLGAWSAMRVDVCEASRQRGEQSEEVRALRVSCLDERLQEARTFSELLGRADAALARRAVEAAGSLRPLEPCADVAALLSRLKPPETAQALAQVNGLRKRLGAARATLQVGRFAEAHALVLPVAAEARKVNYQPALAEVLALQGEIEEQLGQKQAIDTLKQALQAATTSHHDEAALEALITAMRYATNRTQYAEALQWGFWGQLFAEQRAPGDPLRGKFLTGLGKTHLWNDRPQEAIQVLELALFPGQGKRTVEPLARAFTLMVLGTAYMEVDRAAESAKLIAEALEIRQQLLGPEHPDVAFALGNLGIAMGIQGDLDASRGFHERALALIERFYTKQHLFYARATLNLAETELHLGEARRALELADETLASVKADPERNETQESADAYATRAGALLKLGRPREALASAMEAVGLFPKLPGMAPPQRLPSLYWLAESQLANGHVGRALAAGRQALALPRWNGALGPLHGLVRFVLARALEAKGQKAQAQALGEEALRELRKVNAPQVPEVERWLAAR